MNATEPDKPFFLYYVPGSAHSPHQPTKEWIEKFKGKFDMGCEKMREEIFANQKRLGVKFFIVGVSGKMARSSNPAGPPGDIYPSG